MNSEKILYDELAPLLVSSLPTRPSASTAFGGGGFSPAQLKDAFDKLPMLLVRRYNDLIDDIRSTGDSSLAGEILTGIGDYNHSLSNMFSDITNGNFASYLNVGGESLASLLAKIKERLDI